MGSAAIKENDFRHEIQVEKKASRAIKKRKKKSDISKKKRGGQAMLLPGGNARKSKRETFGRK